MEKSDADKGSRRWNALLMRLGLVTAGVIVGIVVGMVLLYVPRPDEQDAVVKLFGFDLLLAVPGVGLLWAATRTRRQAISAGVINGVVIAALFEFVENVGDRGPWVLWIGLLGVLLGGIALTARAILTISRLCLRWFEPNARHTKMATPLQDA